MVVCNFFTDGKTKATSFIFLILNEGVQKVQIFFSIDLVETNAIIADLDFIIFSCSTEA